MHAAFLRTTLVSLLVFGCDASQPLETSSRATSPLAAPPQAPRAPLVVPPSKLPRLGESAVTSSFGVVTSVERPATEVGVEILEGGGNAIDAAVGAAFALAVTHQSAASLGGGGFLVFRSRDLVTSFDFRENSPANFSRESFGKALANGAKGPLSVGVPGFVKGLLAAHAKYGKLPLETVLAGAIRLAEKGYPLGPHQARALRANEKELKKDPVFRELFYSKGVAPLAGAKLKNARLAKLLRALGKNGSRAFYAGSNAEELARTTKVASFVSDLARYEAVERKPLEKKFGEYRVFTMPPPSGGGVVLLEALGLLEEVGAGNGPLGTREFHLIAEALRRAHVDRRLEVSDPDALSPEQLEKKLSSWLSGTRHAKHPIDPAKKTNSRDLDARFADAVKEVEHTTHLSVVDRDGAAVSLTVTLSSSFGSKVIAPSGFVLNNSLLSFASIGENLPRPNVRTISSMAPTLVLHPSGDLLVLGSPGGDTIPATILEVFLRIIRGTSLVEAARSPRIHQGFVPDVLFVEGALPASIRAGLRALGHEVEQRPPIGDANIAASSGITRFAVADGREGGFALGAKR